MKPLEDAEFAFWRVASGPGWLLKAVARVRSRLAGNGPRTVGRQGAGTDAYRPLFDREIIAAACGCPRLAVELLATPRDEAERPAGGPTRPERDA